MKKITRSSDFPPKLSDIPFVQYFSVVNKFLYYRRKIESQERIEYDYIRPELSYGNRQ